MAINTNQISGCQCHSYAFHFLHIFIYYINCHKSEKIYIWGLFCQAQLLLHSFCSKIKDLVMFSLSRNIFVNIHIYNFYLFVTFHFDKFPQAGCLCPYAEPILVFLRNAPSVFCKSCTMYCHSLFSTFSQAFVSFWFLDDSHSNWSEI